MWMILSLVSVVPKSLSTCIKVGAHDGTSPCESFLRQVAGTSRIVWTGNWSLRLVAGTVVWIAMLQNLVAGTKFLRPSANTMRLSLFQALVVGRERKKGRAREKNEGGLPRAWNRLDATSPCDLLQGLVARTSPIVCADLNAGWLHSFLSVLPGTSKLQSAVYSEWK